jgi:hypothetical protein
VEGQAALEKNAAWQAWFGGSQHRVVGASPPLKQELTHQQVIARFWEVTVGAEFRAGETNWMKESHKNLQKFAFPKVVVLYFQQKNLPLNLF